MVAPISPFQCPEGLIVYFTSSRLASDAYTAPDNAGMFQCPEGLIVYFTATYIEAILDEKKFQCPEGLIVYFTQSSRLARLSSNATITFQCPEGLIVYFT
jgi:hypothetical protein